MVSAHEWEQSKDCANAYAIPERIDGGAAEEVIGPQRDGHRGVFQRVDAIDASKVGLSIACNCSREIVRGDALFVARPRKEMKSVAMLLAHVKSNQTR